MRRDSGISVVAVVAVLAVLAAGGAGYFAWRNMVQLDRLQSELAVLSACETGLGRQVQGEGQGSRSDHGHAAAPRGGE